MTMHPLLARIRNIVADPRREWPLIATESGDPARLLVGYVALLAAIPAISAFIAYRSPPAGCTIRFRSDCCAR
jgi:hypothetical protein